MSRLSGTSGAYMPPTGSAVAKRAPYHNYQTELRIWWREIDRTLLFLIISLIVIGAIAVAAASPASARRLSTAETKLDDLYFYWKHLRWQLAGLVTLLGVSFLPQVWARRMAIMLGGAMIFALVLVPFIGAEVNGARRWLDLGIRFQPSEFLKPAFAVMIAWILSWRLRDPHMPVIAVSAAVIGTIVVLMMMQPNFGGTLLFAGCWFALILLAGVPWKRIGAIVLGLFAGVGAAYFLYVNARNRIDAFLGGGSAYDQVGLAASTLQAGGWTGSGLWLGVKKMSLPEAHTDYIFSVIGEEFGLIICALVVLMYLAIVLRVLARLVDDDNLFRILASTGLVVMFGGQAFINILVNLQMFPSKGMTLPLISYGGSSTIAVCLTMGLLLAMTRRNPYITRESLDIRGTLLGRDKQ